MSLGIRLAEAGYVPDRLVRHGIRRILRRRLEQEEKQDRESLLRQLRASPVAVETAAANEQHYEIPADFYRLVLGPHLKYSSAWWDETTTDLGDAEAAMLARTCERADLEDGQDVLELGCGWGSLTLWMARHYPNSRFTAVSNSHSQREFIAGRLRDVGLQNVQIVTRDANDFIPEQTFDRVVSVEMFEHLRNPELLFRRIAGWLRPSGKLFVHVFCHRDLTYLFEDRADDDWMGRHFFTGGTMPSHALLPQLAHTDFVLDRDWRIDGRHYQRTLEAWLCLMDARRAEVRPLLEATYGADADIWFQRWRVFFMACAELFGYRRGDEWGVSHYRFSRR